MEAKGGAKRLSVGCIVVFPKGSKKEEKQFIARIIDIDYSVAKKAEIIVVLEMPFGKIKRGAGIFTPSVGNPAYSVGIKEIEKIDPSLLKRLRDFARELSLEPAHGDLARSLFSENIFR